MELIVKMLAALVGLTIYLLFGSLNISNAITSFQKGEYKRCGVGVMGTVMMIAFAIKLIFSI